MCSQPWAEGETATKWHANSTLPWADSRHGYVWTILNVMEWQLLCTIIDRPLHRVEVKPLPRKTAQHVLAYLESKYLPRHGAPKVVITDNGLEFKNQLVEGYLQRIGVEVRHCTPQHPQSNGKIERFHKTLKQLLTKLDNGRGGEWGDCLGPALWAHRVRHHLLLVTHCKCALSFLWHSVVTRTGPQANVRLVGWRAQIQGRRAKIWRRVMMAPGNNVFSPQCYFLPRWTQDGPQSVRTFGDQTAVRLVNCLM